MSLLSFMYHSRFRNESFTATTCEYDGMDALVYEEPTLLDTIVAFLPVVEEATGDDTTQSRPLTDHLKTLAALCRAFPLLGSRIGPNSRRFWQSLVLRHFDFTTHDGEDDWFEMTADRKYVTYAIVRSSAAEPVCFPPREDWHWLIYEMSDHESSRGNAGDCMLGEYPNWWPSIGAYFRASEYAFLHNIQAGIKSIDDWPDHEDSFTLYCDLVLLKERVAKFDTLETHGASGFSPEPILMSHMDEEIMGPTGYPYGMLRHCHISPFFWTGLPPVSEKWSGLDVPLTLGDEGSLLRTQEEDEIFPLTPSDPHTFHALRQLVHEAFDDWRRVHVNFDENEKWQRSPEFYIGKSRKSGRWLGFIGESDTYCRGSGAATLATVSSS